MKWKTFVNWRENRVVLLVLVLYLPAFCWWGAWSNGTVLRWWQSLYGKVSAPVFFEWEEFIALHSHGNEYPGRIGLYLIIAVLLVLLLLSALKYIRTSIKELLVLLVFTVFILFFSICMCQSKEKQQRRFCPVNLKTYHQAFEAWLAGHETYPPELQSHDFPGEDFSIRLVRPQEFHYLYPAAGKRPGRERFLLLEDAPRAHAGDLRHRLWSDGTIDSIYPWKEKSR